MLISGLHQNSTSSRQSPLSTSRTSSDKSSILALHLSAPQCPLLCPTGKMITKFMTEVTAKFNPFSTCAKPARLFLTFLPPNVRANGTVVNTALLPRDSAENSSLKVKFSAFTLRNTRAVLIGNVLTYLRRGWQGNGLQLLKNQHQESSRGGRPSFAPITKGR